ncbi:MAG: DNA recombination protein RmuC [Bacillota bacterium]
MEILLTIALVILIILLAVNLFIQISNKKNEKELDLVLKNNLDGLRREIQDTVYFSRKEMTDAREDMNRQAVSTLKLLVEMQSTIERIISQQEQANKLGQSLKDVLAAPKLRGNYGEVILEELLERVLPKGMWNRQYRISEGCMVDVAVTYKGLVIPIDSKFPRDNYLRYLESEQKEEKELYWKTFEKDVINRIREIAKYIQPGNGTADFALMFIPSEAIYYETIAEKNYLGQTSKVLQEAERLKVIPVSPNNFYVFLQVILTGMRNLEILTHAREIQNKLARVHGKFDLFYKQYETVGKEIEKAADAFRKGDKHIGLYKRELDDIVEIGCVEREKLS